MTNQIFKQRRRFLKYAGFAIALSPLLRVPGEAIESSDKVDPPEKTVTGAAFFDDSDTRAAPA